MAVNASVGWYDGRNKAFVQVDKGLLQAAFGHPVENVRAEALEDYVVLTKHDNPTFGANQERYVGDLE